jgi:hypothetical protein
MRDINYIQLLNVMRIRSSTSENNGYEERKRMLTENKL